MAKEASRRQRILLAIVIASIVIVVSDVIAVNIAGGDLSDVAWTLAVPVGLLLVPIVGIVSFVMWFSERRAHRT